MGMLINTIDPDTTKFIMMLVVIVLATLIAAAITGHTWPGFFRFFGLKREE